MSAANWKFCSVDGEVQGWGEPSEMVWQCSSQERQMVLGPCWKYLHVTVYVRDTWIQHGNSRRIVDDGWWYWCSYTVDSWAAVRPTFHNVFSSGGLYHRVAFFVEGWSWTPADGWEADDHL